MYHVSSNLTLLLKFFIPVFWIVFFGAFTIAVLASQNAYFGNIPAFIFKLGALTFYLLGILLLYLYLLRLKRIEMDGEGFIASNYFKSFRYPWEDVEYLTVFDLTLMQFVRIRLKATGSFGKSIPFVASRRRLKEFSLAFPELSKGLFNMEEES